MKFLILLLAFSFSSSGLTSDEPIPDLCFTKVQGDLLNTAQGLLGNKEAYSVSDTFVVVNGVKEVLVFVDWTKSSSDVDHSQGKEVFVPQWTNRRACQFEEGAMNRLSKMVNTPTEAFFPQKVTQLECKGKVTTLAFKFELLISKDQYGVLSSTLIEKVNGVVVEETEFPEVRKKEYYDRFVPSMSYGATHVVTGESLWLDLTDVDSDKMWEGSLRLTLNKPNPDSGSIERVELEPMVESYEVECEEK